MKTCCRDQAQADPQSIPTLVNYTGTPQLGGMYALFHARSVVA
jgi:hypothetical protein